MALTPGLEDLVRLGFEQVRVFAAPYPVISRRLVELLEHIARIAADDPPARAEAERQIALLREGVEGNVPMRADVQRVHGAGVRGGHG